MPNLNLCLILCTCAGTVQIVTREGHVYHEDPEARQEMTLLVLLNIPYYVFVSFQI